MAYVLTMVELQEQLQCAIVYPRAGKADRASFTK